MSVEGQLLPGDLAEPERLPAVLLGSAPGTPGAPPWSSEAGSTRRLADLLECEPGEVGARFGLDNLLWSWEGAAAGVARPGADELREAGRRYPFIAGFRYVLAGQAVTRALGSRILPASAEDLSLTLDGGPPLLRWYLARCGATVAVISHPSGRNRWYNRAFRREAAGRFLRGSAWRGPGSADDLWRSRDVSRAIVVLREPVRVE